MFRNYLAAALRNLVRNRLYTTINIVGLAVGFAAALLIALFVRDELSYDKWIPGYERTYAVLMRARSGADVVQWNTTTIDMAELLRLDFPAIENAARIRAVTITSLRHGERDFGEIIYWADANIFRVLPLRAIAGDLVTALEQPDGVVLTRRMARKYFGRDDPLGETLEINHANTFRVTAVIEDLPSNTTLNTDVIAAGSASFSPLTLGNGGAARGPGRPISVRAAYTFIRLKPGASIETLREGADAFATRRLQDEGSGAMRRQEPVFVPLGELHLTPFGDNPMTPPGSMPRIRALGAVGLIVVALAVINFVNLMTARANRRAIEVGVRKASGAERRHLIVQFVGEALAYATICMGVGLMAARLLLPELNGFLQRRIAFHVLHEGPALAVLLGISAAIGLLAGFYPAFVLSAFRPASVLKGAATQESRSRGWLRQGFVALQFAILICLMIGAGVIARQTSFAENEGLRLDKDQIVLIQTACRTAFKDEVGKFAGVSASACSALAPISHYGFTRVPLADGTQVFAAQDPVDFGFFELYGLQPLAGRFLSRDRGKDVVVAGHENDQPNVVINETAVAKFGFASPRAAIGQSIPFQRFNSAKAGQLTDLAPAEIVGVVADFPIGSISTPILPTIFFVDPSQFQTLQVKLSGREIPETLRQMVALWGKYTNGFPFAFTFFDQRVQAVYLDVAREGQLLAILSAIAIFIAGLGLFGLAAFTAERRTKEIGVRKAMGATRRDILRLLLWEFSKPVLWANVIAWPAAYVIARRWLEGFAYHIDLAAWMFVAASALALLIALLTVMSHVLLVARSQPVTALRYE